MYSILLPVFCLVNYVTSSLYFDTGYNHLKQLMFASVPLGYNNDVDEKWIQQPLDHFDKNSKTWPMRYFEHLDYAKDGGPVYIFIGGEGEGDPRFLTIGIIKDLAEETGGALYETEHRYYGKSRPFENTDAESFKWLSSEQALADVANLIKYLKANKYSNSKFVVIGGSYAGNLAAWMRLKYPDLVDAAIASSGPVLAKKDFYEYLEKVNEDYGRYGTPGCLNKISSIFKTYKELLQTKEGIEQLKKDWHICDKTDLNDKLNQMVFYIVAIGPFMVRAQYGGPGSINRHCSKLKDAYNNLMAIKDFKELWNTEGKCFDTSINDYVAFLERYNDAKSWLYQECTEFGYFQTTSSESQPFGHVLPKEFYLELCKRVFGPQFDEARVDKGVEATNKKYGARTPAVSRVVFTNGDVDPWSTLSVLKDLSDESPAVVIPKAVHCADLFLAHDVTEEVKEAYENNKKLIKKWIGARI